MFMELEYTGALYRRLNRVWTFAMYGFSLTFIFTPADTQLPNHKCATLTYPPPKMTQLCTCLHRVVYRELESEKGSQQTRLEYITGLGTPQRLWLSLFFPPSSYRT